MGHGAMLPGRQAYLFCSEAHKMHRNITFPGIKFHKGFLGRGAAARRRQKPPR